MSWPLAGAQGYDGCWNYGEAGDVEGEEHAHGMGSGVFFAVEGLQLLHGLDAEGGGGVIEAEHVCGEIEENGAGGGVIFGYAGEDNAEEGRDEPGEGRDETGGFGEFHEAEPEGDEADVADLDQILVRY